MHVLQSLSFIPKRLFRLIVPLIGVFLFSLALGYLFILNQLPPAPKAFRRISWQKWDVVSLIGSSSNVPSNPEPNTNSTNGKEWWQAEELDAGEAPAGVSLPLDVWSPLLPHSTGLTEIAIRPCLVSPSIAGDICAPKTTPEEDALKGKWVRVGKDLNVMTGMWWLSIYYRRTRRLDVPLITSLHLLRSNESVSSLPGSEHSWVRASGDLHDGLYPSEDPLYLYYEVKKPLAGIPAGIELEELVTEVDVQYGEAKHVAWGFSKSNIPVVEGRDASKPRQAVWITYRKGMNPSPKAPPLHFSDDGKFKILQVADLHYSVSGGECLDVDPNGLPSGLLNPNEPCHGDTVTQSLLAQTLAAERPSLVVFTGDQLNGQTTSWDAQSVLLKAIGEVIAAKVPWALVFGNHDDEDTDLTRSEMMRVAKRMPYAVREMEEGPQWVDGVGNWLVKVKSADSSATHLLTLYFLDSHAYSKSGWTFWKSADYDWIKQSQIDWYIEQSALITPVERPFTPDGAKDLGTVWETRQEDKRLAKPNALMFFHIPLPESYSPADVSGSGETLSYGQQLDESGAPKKNSGFFEKGILTSKESEDPTNTRHEVKVVANGHCHITDFCKRVKGVWLCFGGGSSFSGYGKVGFDRRLRIYDVMDYGETIRTYKRGQDGTIMGDTILEGKGSKGR